MSPRKCGRTGARAAAASPPEDRDSTVTPYADVVGYLSTSFSSSSGICPPPPSRAVAVDVSDAAVGRRLPDRKEKMERIREQRRTTVLRPELMSAIRRVNRTLRDGEVTRAEDLSVTGPLDLQLPPESRSEDSTDEHGCAAEMEATFYRRVPTLRVPRDEGAYRAAVSRGGVTLITADAEGGGWYCQKPIGIASAASASPGDWGGGEASSFRIGRGKGKMKKELCLSINGPSDATCRSCRRGRTFLRAEFALLRRISSASRRQTIEYLRRMVELDDLVFRCGAALDRAQEKLSRSEEEGRGAPSPVVVADSLDEEDLPSLLMDVDVANGEVWQRAEVRYLVPALEERRRRAASLLRTVRGEICVLTQAVWEMAVPHAQKLVRGHLARSKLDARRRIRAERDRNEAAVKVQRIARGLLGRWEAQQRWWRLRNGMAIHIQTAIRRKLAFEEWRRRYQRFLTALHRSLAIRIQCWFRGILARVLRHRLAEDRLLRSAEAERALRSAARERAALSIQRLLRGFLARRRVTERKIELGLHDRLVGLLDRLTIDGDLWTFLKNINADYRRYERLIDLILEREDTMATTFVSKVMKVRREENAGAWNEYLAVKEGHALQLGDRDAERPLCCEEKESLNHPIRVPPGEVLPRATRALATPNATNAKLREGGDCTNRFFMYQPRHSLKRAQPPVVPVEGGGWQAEPSPLSQNDHIESELRGILSNAPWLRGWEWTRVEEMNDIMSHMPSTKFPSFALRRDVPNGLGDTVTRLINAVSMRCSNSRDTLSHENFLKLSPGLQKSRYEHEAKQAALPITDQLLKMGYVYIQQVLPRSRMSSLLQNLTVPLSKDFIMTCDR